MSMTYNINDFSKHMVKNVYDRYNLFTSVDNLKDILKEELNIVMNDSQTAVYDVFNDIISTSYPGEVNIKANLFKKLMCNHDKTTIFEVPLGNSRADIMSINGESVVYEIKSEIDTLSRLEKQVNNYYNYSEKVYVVCTKKDIINIIKMVPNSTGIIIYTKTKNKIKFHYYRKAIKVNEIDPLLQLSIISSKYLNKLLDRQKYLSKSECIDEIAKSNTKRSINIEFKKYLKYKYKEQFNFVKRNINEINDIDIQTFYKINIDPRRIYKKDRLS